jgi:phage host-nuclease inhibitor protein Gam
MNTEKLREFADLYLKHKKLEAECKVLAKEIEQMESVLIDHLMDEGVDKVSLTGGITVSISRQVWPKYKFGKGKEDLVAALKKEGLENLVTTGVNAQTFAALLREYDRDGHIPPAIAEVVEASDVNKLKAKEL